MNMQKIYSHLPIFFIFFKGMGIANVDGSSSSKIGVCLELAWQKPALIVSFFTAQFGNVFIKKQFGPT